jgi:hypothetical protein
MTREDIIRMAQEAGFEFNSLGGTYTSGKLDEHLEHFATLVAAAEIEECAKVCEEHWRNNGNAMECADAIRSRGKE